MRTEPITIKSVLSGMVFTFVCNGKKPRKAVLSNAHTTPISKVVS